jgi:hypothetical protein
VFSNRRFPNDCKSSSGTQARTDGGPHPWRRHLQIGSASSGGGIGGFFTNLLGGLFGGHRAGGGDVSPGQGYIVGESGPEWFSPSTSGMIIPAGVMGRGGDVYNIDARGADAGVEQRVRRAIAESQNQSVQRSVSTVFDITRRK